MSPRTRREVEVHARLTGQMPMRMLRWMRNVATGWSLLKKSAMFLVGLDVADLDVAVRDELADVEVA